jgi:membrane protein implicated in regulation of membrane protease activity
MLIVALVLAVIGLAALVTAVVTSNELIAWVCIGASVIGVLLLIVDALRDRSRGGDEDTDDTDDTDDRDDETTVIPAVTDAEDYPDEPAEAETSAVSTESNDDSSADSKRD